MTTAGFVAAAIDMVSLYKNDSTGNMVVGAGSHPIVPDSDHNLAGDTEILSLWEQIRFLSRTYKELDVLLDPNTKCIWCYQRPKGATSFTPNMVGELIGLRRAIQALTASHGSDAEPPVRSYVLASQIPGIYNLGGDLSFLANAIRRRDRETIRSYAHDCVDVVYHIATGFDWALSRVTPSAAVLKRPFAAISSLPSAA
jgi:DSF synthase